MKGVLGPEMSRAWGAWFQVSDKTKGRLLQRTLSHRDFFLPKAAYALTSMIFFWFCYSVFLQMCDLVSFRCINIRVSRILTVIFSHLHSEQTRKNSIKLTSSISVLLSRLSHAVPFIFPLRSSVPAALIFTLL